MTFKQGSLWGIKRANINFIYQFEKDFLPGRHKNGILKQILRALDSETGRILRGPEVFTLCSPVLQFWGQHPRVNSRGQDLQRASNLSWTRAAPLLLVLDITKMLFEQIFQLWLKMTTAKSIRRLFPLRNITITQEAWGEEGPWHKLWLMAKPGFEQGLVSLPWTRWMPFPPHKSMTLKALGWWMWSESFKYFGVPLTSNCW